MTRKRGTKGLRKRRVKKTAQSTIHSGTGEVKGGRATGRDSCASRSAARAQPAKMAGGGLEEPPATLSCGPARAGRALQIVEVSCTNSTADRAQVKFDVLGQRGLECSQQEAPQLFPARTTQPPAPPDFSHRVDSVVASPRQRGHAQPQGLVAAEIALDGRHPFGRQHLVEIGEQIGVRMCIRSSHLRDYSRLWDCLPPPDPLGSIKPLLADERAGDVARKGRETIGLAAGAARRLQLRCPSLGDVSAPAPPVLQVNRARSSTAEIGSGAVGNRQGPAAGHHPHDDRRRQRPSDQQPFGRRSGDGSLFRRIPPLRSRRSARSASRPVHPQQGARGPRACMRRWPRRATFRSRNS